MPTSSERFEISLFSTSMKFLIPELSSHDDIFVFDTEQMLDRASPRKPFELILNKSLNEFSLEVE